MFLITVCCTENLIYTCNQGDPESRLSSPRPMTPRRVKRRSVNSRGLPLQRPIANDQTSQYYRSHRQNNHVRSSQRRHRVSHQNPVTRLIDQQQKQGMLHIYYFILISMPLKTFVHC